MPRLFVQGATFIPSLNSELDFQSPSSVFLVDGWITREFAGEVMCRSIVLLLQGLEDVGKVILFLLPAMCLVESIDHMILGENIGRVCGRW